MLARRPESQEVLRLTLPYATKIQLLRLLIDRKSIERAEEFLHRPPEIWLDHAGTGRAASEPVPVAFPTLSPGALANETGNTVHRCAAPLCKKGCSLISMLMVFSICSCHFDLQVMKKRASRRKLMHMAFISNLRDWCSTAVLTA